MTVALRLGEVTVDALVDKLQNGLAGRIQAINAEKADDIRIAPPRTEGGPSRDGSDYYRGGTVQQPEGSTVVIVTQGIAEFTNVASHSFIYEPRLLVRVVTEDANREALGVRLQRLARAVIECVYDDDPKETLLTPGAGETPLARIFMEAERPGPVFEPDEKVDAWRSFHDILFAVTNQAEGD